MAKSPAIIVAGSAAALVVTILLSFVIGHYPVRPSTALAVLVSRVIPIKPFWPAQIETIVLGIRLPRILAAMLVGAALSASGAAYQGVFRNPIVSPDILGVASGASFGAALALLLKIGPMGVQAAAFASGLLAIGATYLIGSWRRGAGDGVLTVILTGMIVGLVFQAFISFIKYIADPYNALPAITFWLMGSLASISTSDLAIAAVPISLGLALLISVRWRLNVLTFGDEEAWALGVDAGRIRLAAIVGATLVTAAAVAISGVIGLVGLVVPHLGRMLVGPNYRILLPLSMILGAAFLVAVDDIARALTPGEMPLGILSSLLGAPVFLYLLLKSGKSWA